PDPRGVRQRERAHDPAKLWLSEARLRQGTKTAQAPDPRTPRAMASLGEASDSTPGRRRRCNRRRADPGRPAAVQFGYGGEESQRGTRGGGQLCPVSPTSPRPFQQSWQIQGELDIAKCGLL